MHLLRTAAEHHFTVLAYCFMPDHVHLAVEGCSDDADLRAFVKLLKQRIEFEARRNFRIYPLWQEGYFERVVRSDEATEVLVRYILDNPVRAHLVDRAEDYSLSGALYWPQ